MYRIIGLQRHLRVASWSGTFSTRGRDGAPGTEKVRSSRTWRHVWRNNVTRNYFFHWTSNWYERSIDLLYGCILIDCHWRCDSYGGAKNCVHFCVFFQTIVIDVVIPMVRWKIVFIFVSFSTPLSLTLWFLWCGEKLCSFLCLFPD